MEDINNLQELPKGWVETTLGKVVTLSDKKVEPSALEEVPYIGLEHIEKDTGSLLGFGKSSDVKSTKSKFHTGDLLYGKLRPYLNKVVCVDFEGVCSTDILVFTKNPCVSNKFLLFRLLSRDFVRYASQNVSGVQHPRVNFQTLSEFPLSLPPLSEQRRLVTKIEALKTRSQRAKNALSSIPALLDQFRQSVLAAAFSGALTADWREKNPDVEPAELLLEDILIKRREKWEASQLAKMQANGKTPKNNEWKQKYSHPEAPDSSELLELPKGWIWVKLDSLCTNIGDVDHKMPKAQEYGIPYVSTKDFIDNGQIDFENAKKISQEDFQALCRKIYPNYGDILLSRYGTVGEVRLITTKIPFQASYSIAILKPAFYDINEFIALCLQSQVVQAQIKKYIRGVAQPDLGLTHIKELALPLPSTFEQKEIIQRVKVFLKVISIIEQQYQQTKGAINQLDQSILAEAFRGALVPQDPNDEPASVLLERIRAEREKNTGATSKRSKKSADTFPSQNNKNTGATPKRSNKSTPFKEAVQMELELE